MGCSSFGLDGHSDDNATAAILARNPGQLATSPSARAARRGDSEASQVNQTGPLFESRKALPYLRHLKAALGWSQRVPFLICCPYSQVAANESAYNFDSVLRHGLSFG